MNTYCVYLLKRGSSVFYIGCTGNCKVRLMSHKRTYGKDIRMYVLSSFSSLSEALVEEKIMILKYKKLGFDLTNKESGRPKVSDKVSLVTFTVPESEIEYAKSLAAQEGKTLPQIMQRFLREYLDDLVK